MHRLYMQLIRLTQDKKKASKIYIYYHNGQLFLAEQYFREAAKSSFLSGLTTKVRQDQ